eukprot:CAMPEP_0170173722 /NCGR_PEP_ID=MMETSP0040_2-20121228/6991_1 /TAXON_ID=641309 /ORGANISM="Lotharella oceanica, Strain CCMP622" /LENGTH=86 /DNA_ID=CAMNT_0010415035 /DNA_START=187 /DNA_END=448 /DNA_ORIENTATION=-
MPIKSMTLSKIEEMQKAAMKQENKDDDEKESTPSVCFRLLPLVSTARHAGYAYVRQRLLLRTYVTAAAGGVLVQCVNACGRQHVRA